MPANVVQFKHKWAFSLLWTNVAVALTDLIVFAGGAAHTTREMLQTLAFTFIYANLTSVLALFTLGRLVESAVIRGVSPWKIGVPGILVFVLAGCLLAQSILAALGFSPTHSFWLDYYHILRIAVPLALVFGLGAMAHASLLSRVQVMQQELHMRQIAEERSRKLAAEERLRSLESWIHPHFLFNTLNSISALIPLDPARAEQIVGRLATLLRASLDSSTNSLIPLRQEIAIVEDYLDIERVRLGAKLRARVDVAPELIEFKVPPVSVQSLVENAVKHGITPQTEGGDLVVAARAVDAGLCIEVSNTGPGFNLADMRAGHGLDRLVQRLEALFGNRARLNVVRRGAYSVVEMVVPRV